jgi:hypothetical protein
MCRCFIRAQERHMAKTMLSRGMKIGRTSMKWALGIVVGLGIAASAGAETKNLGKLSVQQVKGMCGGQGDVYTAPSQNGVYGCLKANGDLISCGGAIKNCTQTRQVPTGGRPTAQTDALQTGGLNTSGSPGPSAVPFRCWNGTCACNNDKDCAAMDKANVCATPINPGTGLCVAK